jgi:hypothetical protein
MKTFLALLSAFIGGIALPTLLMAGPTENITGCATAPATNSNFTVRLDPNCPLSADESDGSGLLVAVAAAAFIDAMTPDDEDE